MPVWHRGASVDGISVCHGEHNAGGALHGVCSVTAGAAGGGVVGATAVGSLTAWVAGANVDAAGATLPMLVEVVTFSIGMWVSVPDPLWQSGVKVQGGRFSLY